MNRIEDFKIRDCRDHIHNKYLTGNEAVIEYIRQKCSILKNELWWDYSYGLDYQNLNEDYIISWLDDSILDIEFVKNIINIEVTKNEEKQVINVKVEVELINGYNVETSFNI